MDVSASMRYAGMASIQHYVNLIERNIIDLFADKSSYLNQELVIDKNIKLFAYAYGVNHPLHTLRTAEYAAVKNLLSDIVLSKYKKSDPISLADLIDNWAFYQQKIKSIAPLMYGTSTMLEGLNTVEELFDREQQQHTYGNKILIIFSDGEAPDSGAEDIITKVEQLRDENIVIISLYINDHQEITPKSIYAQSPESWSEGAKLMFDCASYMNHESFLFSYLKAQRWTIPTYGKLITQIPNSAIFQAKTAVHLEKIGTETTSNQRNIVIIHSEKNQHNLHTLQSHLRILQGQATLLFWSEKDIQEKSLAESSSKIESDFYRSQAIILMVSPHLMASGFMQGSILGFLLQQAKSRGTEIIPIILESSRFRYKNSLQTFEAINSYNQPLRALCIHDQDKVFAKVIKQIQTVL